MPHFCTSGRYAAGTAFFASATAPPLPPNRFDAALYVPTTSNASKHMTSPKPTPIATHAFRTPQPSPIRKEFTADSAATVSESK
ncbi:hypothetical protein GCM10023079_38620 [Streptomyces chitinivorans]